jgi:hypothetical protein
MALEGELPAYDAVIFSDTGWEPAAVYQHLERLKTETEKAGIPFILSAPATSATTPSTPKGDSLLCHHLPSALTESKGWAADNAPTNTNLNPLSKSNEN